jgi:hypothetical protein
MAKLKNCFSQNFGKGDEIKTFLAAYNGGSEELLTSTSGALDVNIASGDLSVDLDGVYSGGNTDPDNVGVIFHDRAAAPGDTDQTFRSTGASGYSDDILAAALANVFAIDVNAFSYGQDSSGNARALRTDTDGHLQIDIDGVTLTNKGDRLLVTDTYSTLATAQGSAAASGTPSETQVAKGTNQGRIRIQNTSDDEETLYIGPTGVTAATGYPVPACAEIDMELCEDLYVIAGANEAISWATLQLSQ